MRRPTEKKKWLQRQSITTKLSIVLILTALIPLMVLSSFNLYQHGQDMLNRSLEDLEHLAISNANLINVLAQDTKSALHILANDPEVVAYLTTDSGSPESVAESAHAAFRNALNSNPLYEYTYLADSTGTIVISCQLEGLETVAGQNFANRDYFIQGMAGNEYIDVLVGRVSRKLGFYFSAPVRDPQGKVIGVAIIKLQGNAITGTINEMNQNGNTMSALLIDQDGIIVSPPRGHEGWLFHSVGRLSPEIVEKAKARLVQTEIPQLSTAVLADLAGVRESGAFAALWGDPDFVLGYAPIEQLDWVVGINIPPSLLIDRITNLALITVFSGLGLSVIAAFSAILVARSITRPVSKLATAAQNVEEDKPFAPDDIAEVMGLGDEIGHLARVFSAMVLALRARIAELRTIFEISQEISAGVAFEETLVYILEAIHNVIPYDAAELGFYEKEKNQMVVRASANYRHKGAEDPITYYEPEMAYAYAVDGGTLQRLVRARGAVLVANMRQADEDLELGAEHKWGRGDVGSYLGVALKAKSKVIGSIELVSLEPNRFSEDHSRLLASIATQAAIEVQNGQAVLQREQRLAQQIQQMEIVIDGSKLSQQVAQITGSGAFQQIREKIARNKAGLPNE